MFIPNGVNRRTWPQRRTCSPIAAAVVHRDRQPARLRVQRGLDADRPGPDHGDPRRWSALASVPPARFGDRRRVTGTIGPDGLTRTVASGAYTPAGSAFNPTRARSCSHAASSHSGRRQAVGAELLRPLLFLVQEQRPVAARAWRRGRASPSACWSRSRSSGTAPACRTRAAAAGRTRGSGSSASRTTTTT